MSEDASARRLDGDVTVSFEDVVRLARAASAAVRVLGIRQRRRMPPSLQEYLVATKHDTSIPMIERNYSKYIADHADMLSSTLTVPLATR
jgi:hypothetical protein